MNVRQLLFAALCSVPAMANATQIIVDTATDELNAPVVIVGCPGSDTGCSLREAVSYFNGDNTTCGCNIDTTVATDEIAINVSPITLSLIDPTNTFAGNENSNQYGDIDIAANVGTLTIRAGDSLATVVINTAFPKGTDRIFDVQRRALQKAVVFKNLTLPGGSLETAANDTCSSGAHTETADGGILRVDYIQGCGFANGTTSVTLSGCSLAGGAAINGGAITSKGAALTLATSSVSNSTASADGGGIYVGGTGALFIQDGTSIGGGNGAVNGGGIAAEGNTLTLSAVAAPINVITNTASANGGGIYVASGTALLTSGNAIVTINNNQAVTSGGGIDFLGTLFTMNGGTISGNRVTAGNGGGIASGSQIASVIVQRNAVVTGNTASAAGGGLYITNQDGTATGADCVAGASSTKLGLCLSHASVALNHATSGDGGGLALVPTAGTSQSADVFTTSIGGAAGPSPTTGPNQAGARGGGIFAGLCGAPNGCPLLVQQSSVIDSNTAVGNGGGIANAGFALNVTSSTVSNNQTNSANGGGIAVTGTGQALVLAGTSAARAMILGNKAPSGVGGGVYSTATGQQTVVIGQTDIGASGGANQALAGGGAYIDTTGPDSRYTVQNSTIANNKASNGEGGGISINAHTAGSAHPYLTLFNVKVLRNHASANGGGLYNATVSQHSFVVNSTFSEDTADADGGAVFNAGDGGATAFPLTTVCPPSGTPPFSQPSAFTICNSHLDAGAAANTAKNGGAIGNASTLAVYDSFVDGNSAINGGGLANLASGSLYVYQSNVTNNIASGNGGGAAVDGNAVFFGDTLSGNRTLGNGGGIYGGGAGPLAVVYSTLFDNDAKDGGAVFTNNGTSRINNVTASTNTASTGTVAGLEAGSSTQIANSIFDKNLAGGVEADCAGAVSQGHNILGAGCPGGSDQPEANVHLASTLTTIGGLTPVLFTGPGSDAVNNGTPASAISGLQCGALGVSTTPALTVPTTDQRGVPVPQNPGGICDIGAYEATPDLQINAKAAGACPALVAGGSAGSFTARVSNNTSGVPAGTDVATNVVVTITLPAHVVFQGVTKPGNFNCAGSGTPSPVSPSPAPAAGTVGPLSFVCISGASIPASAGNLDFVLSLALDATAPPATNLIYSASVVDQTADPDTSSNNDTQSCASTASVALTLTKDDSTPGISAGGAPLYVVTIANAGPSTAANVQVGDPNPVVLDPSNVVFPSAILSSSWTCVASAGSTCPASGSGPISTTVTIAPGGNVVFSDSVQTSFTIPNLSSITNQADVTVPAIYAGGCSSASLTACQANTAASCHACDKDSIAAAVSELGVSESAPATIAEGGTLVTTTTFTVAGPSSSQNITLTNTVGSAATSFVSYSLDAAATAAFTCSGAPPPGSFGAVTIVCHSIGIVPVGSYVFTSASLVVDDGSTPPAIPYSAALAHSGVPNQLALADPQSLPDSASGTVAVDIESDVAIALSAPATINAGEILSYAITVTDLGPSTARGAAFSIDVPAGTSFVAIDAPTIWACAQSGTTVSCTSGTLSAGEGAQNFTLAVKVDPAAATGTVISASASLAALNTDPHPNNNGPVTATTTVGTAWDLAITLAASPSAVAPGGSVAYAIDLQNNGPSEAQGVVLTIHLPKDVSYQALTLANVACSTPDGTGLITCTVASIAAGVSDTGTLSVTVSNQATNGEVLVTTANVSSGGTDPLPGNNNASASVTVNASLSGDGPVTFGNVTVNHGDVKERGGVFHCASVHGNGATDLAVLLGAAFIATRLRRKKRK